MRYELLFYSAFFLSLSSVLHSGEGCRITGKQSSGDRWEECTPHALSRSGALSIPLPGGTRDRPRLLPIQRCRAVGGRSGRTGRRLGLSPRAVRLLPSRLMQIPVVERGRGRGGEKCKWADVAVSAAVATSPSGTPPRCGTGARMARGALPARPRPGKYEMRAPSRAETLNAKPALRYTSELPTPAPPTPVHHAVIGPPTQYTLR